MFEPVSPERASATGFIMLRDGQIAFSGSADELRATRDPYVRTFLS